MQYGRFEDDMTNKVSLPAECPYNFISTLYWDVFFRLTDFEPVWAEGGVLPPSDRGTRSGTEGFQFYSMHVQSRFVD